MNKHIEQMKAEKKEQEKKELKEMINREALKALFKINNVKFGV